MFRRLVTEHWQASLAIGLFLLSLFGTLLVYLYAFRLPREKSAKRASMAIDGLPEIPRPARTRGR